MVPEGTDSAEALEVPEAVHVAAAFAQSGALEAGSSRMTLGVFGASASGIGAVKAQEE